MNNYNRREFIKNTAIGITTAGLTVSGMSTHKAFSQGSKITSIPTRPFGSTGFNVTEIGFGAMNTRDAELITAAIDAGINYLDTAHRYMNGESEQIIGRIMKTRRNKVFLTTKVSGNPSDIPGLIETSLKRLQTDHVDLLLLHLVMDVSDLRNENMIKAFENARKKGQTRFVGFSSHSLPAEMAETAINSKFWEAVLVAYNYQSPQETADSIKKVREAGLATIAMKSLIQVMGPPPRMKNGQMPQMPPRPPENSGEGRPPRPPEPQSLGDIRKDKTSNITPNQALLRWVLDNPNIDTVIPGMTAFEHLEEDLAVPHIKLSSNEHRMLRRFSENLKGRYCMGLNECIGCKGKCPKGVAVNEINRCLGYAYGYGNIELAKENYRHLRGTKSLEACSDCEECVVKCINGLNLTNNIKVARSLFV